MVRDEDIGYFRKQLLKYLTKCQEISIKSDYLDLYFMFTKLHFFIYFGKSLKKELMVKSPEYKKALKRHVNMVCVLKFDKFKHIKIASFKEIAKTLIGLKFEDELLDGVKRQYNL